MTFTIDDDSFSKLPDRSRLTGLPMPNQAYRDSTQPECVFKWVLTRREIDHAAGQWEAYTRKAPPP